MLVGIPNVGKSALVNSLHKIGRISAAGILTTLMHFHALMLLSRFLLNCWFLIEKGKLRHAMVSPQPCETKDIKSFKVYALIVSSTLQYCSFSVAYACMILQILSAKKKKKTHICKYKLFYMEGQHDFNNTICH